MAKGKKGPALFEVIRAAQQKQLEQQRRIEQQKTAGPGVLTSAASKLRDLNWLRGRNAAEASTSVVAEAVMRETPRVEVPEPTIARQPVMREVAPAPVYEEAIVAPAPVVRPDPVPAEPAAVQPVARPVVTTAPDYAPTPAEDIARRVREEIAAASRIPDTYDDRSPDPVLNNVADLFGTQQPDADDADNAPRRSFQLPFQLNYTTGLAAGIALIVVVSLIVIVAKINGSDAAPATLADSTPRPDVLNVQPERPAVAQRDTPVEQPVRANVAPAQRTVSVESSFQPVPLPQGGKRIIGVQYVVLLSFPREEPARDLVKFLTSKGVAVTAEKGLPGYSKSWFSVVTTTGFHRTRDNPQYDAYIEPINKLMKEYANGSRFKSFKPDIYTWRAS
jgi:hypothetical protein